MERNKWVEEANAIRSVREIEILRFYARGLTINEIADQMFVLAETVKFHRRKLFEKIGVQNNNKLLSHLFRIISTCQNKYFRYQKFLKIIYISPCQLFIMKHFSTGINYFLILFMSYVFTNKLLDIPAFQSNIFKTGLYNLAFTKLLSYCVLFLEFASIVLLIFKKKQGLIYTLVILIIFTLYISILNFLGRYEVCGCGGILNGLSYIAHFLINIFLIIITYLAISIDNKLK